MFSLDFFLTWPLSSQSIMLQLLQIRLRIECAFAFGNTALNLYVLVWACCIMLSIFNWYSSSYRWWVLLLSMSSWVGTTFLYLWSFAGVMLEGCSLYACTMLFTCCVGCFCGIYAFIVVLELLLRWYSCFICRWLELCFVVIICVALLTLTNMILTRILFMVCCLLLNAFVHLSRTFLSPPKCLALIILLFDKQAVVLKTVRALFASVVSIKAYIEHACKSIGIYRFR